MTRNKVYRIILVFLTLSLCSCRNSEQFLYNQGTIALKNGEFDRATVFFNRLTREFPESELVDESLFRLAEINRLYMLNGERALELYSSLLAKYPDSPYECPARKGIAELYFYRFEDYEKAIEHFQLFAVQCLDIDNRAYAQKMIGDCHFLSKNYDQALIEYQIFEEEFRETEMYLPALKKIADCHFIIGNMVEAEIFYRKVLKLSPDEQLKDEIQLNLARVLYNEKQYPMTLDLLGVLMQKYPERTDITNMDKLVRAKQQSESEETGEEVGSPPQN